MAAKNKVRLPPGMTAQMDNVIGRALEKEFGKSKVQALMFEKLKKGAIPQIEAMAAEHLRNYAGAMQAHLTNGFPGMENVSPQIDTGVGEAFSPGSRGMPRWAPLSPRTQRNKQSIRRYRRMWADWIDPNRRLSTALGPALRRLGSAAPKLEVVAARPQKIRVGGRRPEFKIEYVLRFNAGRAAGDPALFKIVMNNFLSGRWHQLDPGAPPSKTGMRSSRAGRPPEPGVVLYVEDMRPMLGPAAALAGRAFRAKLRRLLKS